MSIAKKLETKIKRLPKGKIFSAQDFYNFGDRGNIDVILHRLAKLDLIRKLGYGLYDKPLNSSVLGNLKPTLQDIIKAYRRKTGYTIILGPQAAANALNLTTQVPSQLVFLTDGKSQIMDICGIKIKLVHVSPKKLAGANTSTGILIQGLYYFGKSMAPKPLLTTLAKKINKKDMNTLKNIRNKTMNYIRPQIDWIINHGKV